MDDIEFIEAGEDLYRPGHIIPPSGRANLIPNASFECGTSRWGSAEWDRTTHWGGQMNALFGALDATQAHHGRHSLRIELSEKTQPVSYFDYFDLHRTPIWAPLAANIGWLAVEPGKPHTLSVYLKAAAPNTPALLAIREFDHGQFEKSIRVGTAWERAALTFTPRRKWCYVLAGPDLRSAQADGPQKRQATVWLDALQLEQGRAPTAFAGGDAIEFALSTAKSGNVFIWGEDVAVRYRVAGGGTKEEGRLDFRVTDFAGNEVSSARKTVSGAEAGEWKPAQASPDGTRLRGALRVHVTLTIGNVTQKQRLRLAVIPPRPTGDTRFGVNHAYPWPHLLDRCRDAGLAWVRDWSLKWDTVEPEKGRFAFAEADYQINRPLRHALHVLAMAPFPSSRWASAASPEMRTGTGYRERRSVVAMAPRSMADFESYVRRTVAHYKGRITWWQVFNEPLFTSYALPRKHGYNGATLAKYTKAFARVARATDPRCKILGGIGYIRDGQIMQDWAEFLAAGGLDVVDAVDIHRYPRIRPPEFIEPLLEKLNALMERHGGRKPIWCTEYGYYADDEPWAVPMPHNEFNRPLKSEALQAAYAVRWATLLFANGVDRLFYHAGTCDGINRDSLQGIFFEYAGQPHVIYAAQAVMAHFLTPTCRFVGKLALGEGVSGTLFRDGKKHVAVVWAPGGKAKRTVRVSRASVAVWDMMGRPSPAATVVVDGTPVYLISDGLTDAQFAAAIVREP